MNLLWLLLGIAALVAFIVLEGRRQTRTLAREEGYKSRGANLLGVGMLELQRHLQADRDVKTLQIELQEEDRHHPEVRPADRSDEHDDRSQTAS